MKPATTPAPAAMPTASHGFALVQAATSSVVGTCCQISAAVDLIASFVTSISCVRKSCFSGDCRALFDVVSISGPLLSLFVCILLPQVSLEASADDGDTDGNGG